MPVKIPDILFPLYPLIEQQSTGYHQEQRYANVSEYNGKGFDSGGPQGNGTEFKKCVTEILIGTVDSMIHGDGNDRQCTYHIQLIFSFACGNGWFI